MISEFDHPLAIELDILLEGKPGAAQNAVREEGAPWMVQLVDKHVTPLREALRHITDGGPHQNCEACKKAMALGHRIAR